ncbi:nuclear envelope pore membrane protein POM 121 isoform X2 [Hyla sarda]|uniref:nuclear envelope pore membrane protein POM 121 isoform X2 n=1 Tax=Hyla sarda TaxID=327740 RepID=UPI0024C3AB4A|nr:nuclear envelope pore membrane protein POM 121 isoform X2 [Hyla sarda]
MCPSGGRGGGVRDRLRRLFRQALDRELPPVSLLLPAALLLLVFVYCFPLLSALLLCVLAGCVYWSSGGRLWRFPEWRHRAGGAFGGRQRPVQYRRVREPVVKWSPISLLLLMGSYLGKEEPPARAIGRGTRDLKERLTRPNPTVLTPARRLSFRETPVVSNRTYMSPRRRYPTHQPQYSMPGSLPTVYLEGFPRKAVLSPKHFQMRSPVTVKIARPDLNITRSPVLNSLLSPRLASPSAACAPPDPCAKETVLNAIRESRKRINKDEEYSADRGIENKRRRQVSSGSGGSTSESPEVNGSLSYVSKSDTLKRALNKHLLDETVNKRSRTSSNSSLSSCAMNGFTMPTHNAITSSFSSSRVLLQKRKRNCQNTSVISSPPLSRSQTPDLSAKKAREELHDSSQSTPVKSDSRDQSGQFIETPSSKSSTLNSSVDNGSGGPRRKKVLLVCSGRGEQYPLPPPPVVGYNITSKDLDSEKKAFLQRLNKALEETADTIPTSSAPSTVTTIAASPLFSLATASSTLTSQTSTVSSNPLLQSLAKMQNKEESKEPVQAVAVDVPNNKVPMLGLSSPKDVLGASQNVSLTLTSQPVAAVLSTSTPQPDAGVQNKPESKSSLLQLLTQPSGSNSQSSFKPLFPSNVNANPPSVSSSAPSMPSVSSTNTFKPIFGEQNVQQNQPASTFKPIFGDSTLQQPAASASPFTFQVNSNPTSTAPPSFSGFGATVTSTTQSTDGAAKLSLPLPTSSSATPSFSSAFTGGATSSSAPASAPANTFLGSSTSSDSQTKTTYVFGQAPTSQTPGLNMFGNTQIAPTSQPTQPPMFGSTASAFSAALNPNPPPFPASSSTVTFNSSSVSSVQANKPATNPLANFGTSGGQTTFGSSTQSTFGSSSQTAFGANSQPAFGSNPSFKFGSASATTNPTAFGTMNSTQTNSTPATNQFSAAKPFNFVEKNTAVTFGTTASTVPAPVMNFGNSSVAQNSTSFSFGTPGPTESKLSFGTPATPSFGQNSSPAPVNFGTPTQSFGSSSASFGQANPGFSIGVNSKPSGARQRLMARRQHTRKK